MKRENRTRWLLRFGTATIVLLAAYKLYLIYSAPEANALHGRHLSRLETLGKTRGARFAVVGNGNNSIGVFEDRIVPALNRSGLDFVVSAGNAVSGGGEDKYRSLMGSLERLEIPCFLTFGENESEDFGGYRFYQRFGPHFFTFRFAGARFVFLDSTERTPTDWQEMWLSDLLEGGGEEPVFVFLEQNLYPVEEEFLDFDPSAWAEPGDRDRLANLFSTLGVDIVFSADRASFSDREVDGVRYLSTGGAGGFVTGDEDSFYHYLVVDVEDDTPAIEVVRLDGGPTTLRRRLEGLWFFFYSLFYVGFFNFLLAAAVLLVVGIVLHNWLFRERNYYPDYNADLRPYEGRKLRVAMFTNNYLPFLGGVPISVDRLREGLVGEGHEVLVVAPSYPDSGEPEEGIVRMPNLYRVGRGQWCVPNLFSPRTMREVKSFRPDVIHVHHPYGIGWLGRFMARRWRVPAVFTYHTRLENYSHFLPVAGKIFRNVISHALVERFANRCAAVVVPTPETREYLRIIGVRVPIRVVPTGVAVERFADVPEERIREIQEELRIGDMPVLVSASRLSPEKNLEFLVRGIARLRDRGVPAFRCVLLGDGEDRQHLEKLIHDLELEREVTLVGAVVPSEIPAYYRAADIFVFASKSETQGMVVLEAMAAGLPVVALDASGIDAFVRNDATGYKTLEDLDLWSAAVARLLEQPDLRARLGGTAAEIASRYSIAAFAESIRGVYIRAIAAEER